MYSNSTDLTRLVLCCPQVAQLDAQHSPRQHIHHIAFVGYVRILNAIVILFVVDGFITEFYRQLHAYEEIGTKELVHMLGSYYKLWHHSQAFF